MKKSKVFARPELNLEVLMINGRRCTLEHIFSRPCDAKNMDLTLPGHPSVLLSEFEDRERWVQWGRFDQVFLVRRIVTAVGFAYWSDDQELAPSEVPAWAIQVLDTPFAPPAAEVCLDAETGDLIPHTLEGIMVAQRKSDGFINATAMCKAAGKLVADYMRLAGTKELMEELALSMGIPIIKLVDSRVGGKLPEEQRGTWVHPDVAVNLAQWCSARFAVQVSRWVREWMTTGTVAEFQVPTTRAGLLRLAAEQAERLEEQEKLLLTVRAESEALGTKNLELEGEKEQLSTELSETERHKRDLEEMRAKEDRSMPLSVWLNHVSADIGGGPLINLKVLRALGPLHREFVKGCRTSKESAIGQKWLDDDILFYSSTDWLKRKKDKDKLDPSKPAEVVLDSDGKPMTGESRVILIAPERTDYVFNWLMKRPETLLRRLIKKRRSPTISRLAGRYLFSDTDVDAWNELTTPEKNNGVRMIAPEGDVKEWSVWCDVKKGEAGRKTGTGATLELALLNLAENYNL